MNRFLLDTNILLGLTRSVPWAKWAYDHYKIIPPVPRPAVAMKQNDLWIAATAHASNAKLLTTDKDFEHLRGAWIDVDWIDQSKQA
jgi:tRNA(fMet)-specific endonuclease VapC